MLTLEERGGFALSIENEKIGCADLPLADFHALRAILIAGGLIDEEVAEFSCRNCEAAITIRPCEGLPLGPFRDAELTDEELDTTLPFDTEHAIDAMRVGAKQASSVVFAARTAREAAPLHAALARKRLQLSRKIVVSMGLVRLGSADDPATVARALRECSDDAFDSVTRVWLASHYPLRLGAIAMCESCGARNDVDAPYEREFEPANSEPPESDARDASDDAGEFPTIDAFSDLAHESFAVHSKNFGEDTVDLRNRRQHTCLRRRRRAAPRLVCSPK